MVGVIYVFPSDENNLVNLLMVRPYGIFVYDIPLQPWSLEGNSYVKYYLLVVIGFELLESFVKHNV